MDPVLGPAARCSTSLSISQPLSQRPTTASCGARRVYSALSAGLASSGSARIAMNAEANRFHSLLMGPVTVWGLSRLIAWSPASARMARCPAKGSGRLIVPVCVAPSDE